MARTISHGTNLGWVLLLVSLVAIADPAAAQPAVRSDATPSASADKTGQPASVNLGEFKADSRASESSGWSDGQTTVDADTQTPWWVNAGGVIFSRAVGSNSTLVSDANFTRISLHASDLGQGMSGGPRIAAGYNGEQLGFEAVYFGVDGWSTSWSHAHPGDVTVPFLASAQILDQANLSATSALYNAEANLKWQFTNRLTGLIGFRWAELHEQGAGDASGTGFAGGFHIDSRNDLYGLQIGAQGRLWGETTSSIRIGGFVKAGIFGNHIHTSIDNTGNAALSATPNIDRAAFLGEAGLTLAWQVSKRIEVFGSYEVVWVDGVAVAPDLMVGNNSSTAFYGGAIAGAELKW